MVSSREFMLLLARNRMGVNANLELLWRYLVCLLRNQSCVLTKMPLVILSYFSKLNIRCTLVCRDAREIRSVCIWILRRVEKDPVLKTFLSATMPKMMFSQLMLVASFIITVIIIFLPIRTT